MRPPRDGFVLVSVLWVVALLTVITLSYHHRARLEVQAARYSLDASQAMMSARGAVERGILELRNRTVADALAATPEAPNTAGITHLGQPWARVLDLYGDGGPFQRGEEFENDEITCTIEDLDRYININRIPESVLEEISGISRPVARRIQFQRSGTDDSGAPSEEGAIAFHDVAELRYFRGIDEDGWYGHGDTPGLRALLTTHGDGRVNINTVPIAVLRVLPGVDAQAAADILMVRNGADGKPGTADDRGFADWATFSSETQITGDTLVSLQQLCKFDSNYFKIAGVATRRGGKVRSACAAVVYLPAGSNVARLVSWTEESLGS